MFGEWAGAVEPPSEHADVSHDAAAEAALARKLQLMILAQFLGEAPQSSRMSGARSGGAALRARARPAMTVTVTMMWDLRCSMC